MQGSFYMEEKMLTENEKQQIIEYGLERGKKELIFFGFILLIGLILGIFWQGIIFWLSFCSIRRYAGGYHADTEQRCMIISASVIIIVFLIMRCWAVEIWITLLLQVICYGIIMRLSPVSNKNRILDEAEQKRFRMITHLIATIVMIFSLLLCLADCIYIVAPIAMAYIVLAVALLAGVYKNNLKIHENIFEE